MVPAQVFVTPRTESGLAPPSSEPTTPSTDDAHHCQAPKGSRPNSPSGTSGPGRRALRAAIPCPTCTSKLYECVSLKVFRYIDKEKWKAAIEDG